MTKVSCARKPRPEECDTHDRGLRPPRDCSRSLSYQCKMLQRQWVALLLSLLSSSCVQSFTNDK